MLPGKPERRPGGTGENQLLKNVDDAAFQRDRVQTVEEPNPQRSMPDERRGGEKEIQRRNQLKKINEVKSKAQAAFHNQDYEQTITLYESIAPHLSDAERKMLDYAWKQFMA